MCGVPVERADDYLQRLIGLGHRVAVCEQIEDPGGGEEARRQVGRAPRRGAPRHAGHDHRGQAARSPGGPTCSLAIAAPARPRTTAGATASPRVDISTGRFRAVARRDAAGLAAEIARLEPREILVPDAILDDPEPAKRSGARRGPP